MDFKPWPVRRLQPKSIARFLAALGEPTDVPARSPSRGPPYWRSTVLRRKALGDVGAGDLIDWAALAGELGYFDQAHFARDFKAQLGKTPSEYAALTRPRVR